MTKQSFQFFAFLTTIVLVTSIISAGMILPVNDKAKEHSPVIGQNGDLERVDFVYPAKPTNPGNSNKGPKTESCYKLMGVKWKTFPVDYTINPLNPHNLTEQFVTDTIATSAETWDTEISTELFNDAYSIDYTAQYGIQDYKNSIDFGGNLDSNTIAITSVWYTRKGKQIVEFDMRFNTNYNWGDASVDQTLMDLQNIATHELGHAVGLADIYTDACSTVTMFGYGTNGETEKRTLEAPDITGLQQMYEI